MTSKSREISSPLFDLEAGPKLHIRIHKQILYRLTLKKILILREIQGFLVSQFSLTLKQMASIVCVHKLKYTKAGTNEFTNI